MVDAVDWLTKRHVVRPIAYTEELPTEITRLYALVYSSLQISKIWRGSEVSTFTPSQSHEQFFQIAAHPQRNVGLLFLGYLVVAAEYFPTDSIDSNGWSVVGVPAGTMVQVLLQDAMCAVKEVGFDPKFAPDCYYRYYGERGLSKFVPVKRE